MGRRNNDKTAANEQSANRRCETRPQFVLTASGENHGAREDEAAKGVRVIELRSLPAKFRRDRVLEQTPGIKHTQREIDAQPGEGNRPAAIDR